MPTPPWPLRVKYRLFESKLPSEYLAWVTEDVSSGRWVRNRGIWWFLLAVPIYVVGPIMRGGFEPFDLIPLAAATVGWFIVSRFVAPRIAKGRLSRQDQALFVRYQRGEITRHELANERTGPFSWPILILALGVGAAVAVILLVTVG